MDFIWLSNKDVIPLADLLLQRMDSIANRTSVPVTEESRVGLQDTKEANKPGVGEQLC